MKVKFVQSAASETRQLLDDITTGKKHWMQISEEKIYELNNSILSLHKTTNAGGMVKQLHRLVDRYNYKKTGKGDRLSFIRSNTKTGDSVDFTSECRYNCTYCYVNSPMLKARKTKSWKIPSETILKKDQLSTFGKYLTERNKVVNGYPLRFFSLSDCPDEYIPVLEILLQTCQKFSVKTIVISKNRKVFESKAPDLASTILYSLDNGTFQAPTSIFEYVELYKKNPKIRAFFMATDLSDIKLFHRWIQHYDLHNFQMVGYHGQYRVSVLGKPPVEIETPLNPMLLDIMCNQLYNKGVGCCYYGKCFACSFKCGTNRDAKHSFRVT